MEGGKRESYMSRMEIGLCFDIHNGCRVRRLTTRKVMGNLTGLLDGFDLNFKIKLKPIALIEAPKL